MKILSLRMQNFRQHDDTEVTFGSGITAIIGANGSGKTTVLEAIAWALYGQPAIRGQRDGIRFLGAGARAPVEVELTFELGGHHYRILRGLTTANVYLDGSDSPIASSITPVNELITRRMGMSRGEFFNTYFTSQKQLAVMASMGPTDRAQFLSKVLGYERLRAAQELAREQRRVIGSQIVELRGAMTDRDEIDRMLVEAELGLRDAVAMSNEAGTRHAVALAELKRVGPAWEQAGREREQWQRLIAEITIAESEVATLTRDAERIASELFALASVHDELATLRIEVAPLAEYRAEAQRLDEGFRQQGRRVALIENERALIEELTVLRERLVRLETAPGLEEEVTLDLERARSAGEAIAHALDTQRTAWVRDKQDAETKLQELRRQYAEVKEQRDRLAELGTDGICPTCNRVLGANFQAVVDDWTEKLDTLAVDGGYYRDREQQLSEIPPEIVSLEEQRRTAATNTANLERRLAKVQAAVSELASVRREVATKEQRRSEMAAEIGSITSDYDRDRHAFVRAEIERLAPLDKRATRLEAAIERAPIARAEEARVVDALTSASSRREALRRAGATREFSEEAYELARAANARATEAARTAELAVVSAQGDVRAAQGRVDAAAANKKEHERLADRLRSLNMQRLEHDELDNAYRELRSELNDALRPELSEIASSFLGLLTDDRYARLELDERYDVTILEDDIAKPVISGGEEDLANLVLRLAISQMIADRSGQPFALLVLDEVFGSLDVSRRDNVLALLRGLGDRFEQVILITHIESIRDGVDRVIQVRFDEETGTSKVEAGDYVGVALGDEALSLVAGDSQGEGT